MNLAYDKNVLTEKEISSAEMTAAWRCDEPELSRDQISKLIVSNEGLQKARSYQATQYPFASRHFSLRAGYFLQQACKLLSSGHYNALISIGSGLSLLTHCIVAEFEKQHPEGQLFILDTDLPSMINTRIIRMEALAKNLSPAPQNQFEQRALNIELTYEMNKDNNPSAFKEIFSMKPIHPIFILEGISYFLTKECLSWLFSNVFSYENAAIIFDYWPDDAPKRSSFFIQMLSYFQTNLPENVQCLLSPEHLCALSKSMQFTDMSLRNIEQQLLPKTRCMLTDEQTHIPAHVRVLQKVLPQ
jgi:hypothetical protein